MGNRGDGLGISKDDWQMQAVPEVSEGKGQVQQIYEIQLGELSDLVFFRHL